MAFKDIVRRAVTNDSVLLSNLSQQIWDNPELNFKEQFAHDLLTKVLTEKGFSVECSYILPTAFRATYGNTNSPTICIMCEYDALPEVGHACGHNLIAEAGLGAALGIKAGFEADPALKGRVVVLGTPAEEGGGGKIHLINGGAFKDIDAALMVHPAVSDHLYPPFIAVSRLTATYTGKEAHASGFPWEGINALDAAVASYNNISLLRQHIKPTCRIHGVISKGGIVPNVIPGTSEVKYYYRAPTSKEMETLQSRVQNCISSAAQATGCQVQIESNSSYKALITNKTLADLYKKYAEELGVKFEDGNPKVIPFMASSDVGDVSCVVPSIQPTYSIGTDAPNHSVGFANAAAKKEAQAPTLVAAQTMALAALELFENPILLETAKLQLATNLMEDTA